LYSPREGIETSEPYYYWTATTAQTLHRPIFRTQTGIPDCQRDPLTHSHGPQPHTLHQQGSGSKQHYVEHFWQELLIPTENRISPQTQPKKLFSGFQIGGD
jgi:hypothetical protein